MNRREEFIKFFKDLTDYRDSFVRVLFKGNFKTQDLKIKPLIEILIPDKVGLFYLQERRILIFDERDITEDNLQDILSLSSSLSFSDLSNPKVLEYIYNTAMFLYTIASREYFIEFEYSIMSLLPESIEFDKYYQISSIFHEVVEDYFIFHRKLE